MHATAWGFRGVPSSTTTALRTIFTNGCQLYQSDLRNRCYYLNTTRLSYLGSRKWHKLVYFFPSFFRPPPKVTRARLHFRLRPGSNSSYYPTWGCGSSSLTGNEINSRHHGKTAGLGRNHQCRLTHSCSLGEIEINRAVFSNFWAFFIIPRNLRSRWRNFEKHFFFALCHPVG